MYDVVQSHDVIMIGANKPGLVSQTTLIGMNDMYFILC